jgi:hypothetical protein
MTTMPTTTVFRSLEQLRFVTSMGVRFLDPATGTFVTEGLTVTGYPVGRPFRATAAGQNSTGVYVFPKFPGLRQSEIGAGDDAFRASVPVTANFTIQVVDCRGRFVPFRFNVTLPMRGLVEVGGVPGSPGLSSPPPDCQASVPLFSAVSRSVPGGTGVVRAELHDLSSAGPAAWAVVAVQVGGQPAVWGVADQMGRALVLFDYPEPTQFSPASPPAPQPLPLTQQSWPVSVEVYYSPGELSSPPSSQPAIPDLQALFQQAQAVAWGSVSPLIPLGNGSVTYGQDCLIATENGNVLFVSPAP